MHARRSVVLGYRRVEGTDVGVHHQVRGVARVVGDRLGADKVTAPHAERRCERRIEVSPMNIAWPRRQVMQALASRPLLNHGDS
jgi:hypothetical protein